MKLLKKLLSLIVVLDSLTYARMTVIASIAPEQAIIQEIAGDKASVELMVPPGSSPHSYEPRPSQMAAITKADAYFKIGVEFEQVWLEKFRTQNESMRIFDITKNITKRPITSKQNKQQYQEPNKTLRLDPHIWTTPKNIQSIADNTLKALVSLDPANRLYYTQRATIFAKKTQRLQKELELILNKDYYFMVFHPAWSYLANEFNLHQLPIEDGGKAIKPKQMTSLIKTAREKNVTVIFTSPAFNDQIAKQMASELGIKVVKISTLEKDWYANIIKVAKLISTQ